MKNESGIHWTHKQLNIYSFVITLITYADICEIESRSQIYLVIKKQKIPTKTGPGPDGISGEFYPAL